MTCGPQTQFGSDVVNVKTIVDAGKITTSHISDVAPHGFVARPSLRSLWAGARLSGPAFTVKVAPGDNASLMTALETVERDEVLVVDGAGFTERALWGAIMTYAAMRRGVAGLVVDGAVRDVEEIRTLQFPVFAIAHTPVGPYNKVSGALRTKITCGGVIVRPGDLVYADDDGVVFLPKLEVAELLRAAQQRAQREEEVVQGLSEGESLTGLLPLLRKGTV